jgi:hypothetical protein
MASAWVRRQVRRYAEFRGPVDALVPIGLLVVFMYVGWAGTNCRGTS